MRQLLLCFLSFLLFITGCSLQEYSYQTAIDNGDVVSEGTTKGNLDLFQKFLSDIDTQKPSDVKVTRYSKEGDPIFFKLKYNGVEIQIHEDASKDKYGGGKQVYQCKGVEENDLPEGTEYVLTGCSISSRRPILMIYKK
ncbi:DUF4362 domain-containing protein [Tumebacillus permanentifrigoris]|uniref:Uncharacterized protein DUF4362 n=1 Tax=Tumebacillus permanentifrigoris TaxID=378543 RepID=A0A316D9V9_9BACL|nr:DUF4362 domain-containing protein [Tumebacillus permanentifrigoris]PWK13729.1 uncharacterized protein DUF4362 [Tumebacillus permanentifrigoris]